MKRKDGIIMYLAKNYGAVYWTNNIERAFRLPVKNGKVHLRPRNDGVEIFEVAK
jgi:hypothetical protein